MAPNEVIIARFASVKEANEIADLLRGEGIPCQVEMAAPASISGFPDHSPEKIRLVLHKADWHDAEMVLEMHAARPQKSYSREWGNPFILLGVMVCLIGLLATMSSNLIRTQHLMPWLGYALAMGGAVVFFYGLRSRTLHS